MENTDYPPGFRSPIGTLEEVIDYGFEITFVYAGEPYFIDGWTVANSAGDILLEAEEEKAEELLNMPFLGKTLKEVIDESMVTNIH